MPVDRSWIAQLMASQPSAYRAFISVADYLDRLEKIVGVPITTGAGGSTSASPPAAPTWTANGGNGKFTLSITPPGQASGAPQLQYQIQSATDQLFSQNVSTATLGIGQLQYESYDPGAIRWFRLRSKSPGSNWGPWHTKSASVAARTVPAAAITPTPAMSLPLNGTIGGQPASAYGRAAITQLDASGNIVVLGTAGTGVKLNVGNGSLTPSTGGRQVKRFWITQPTSGGYSDGQVFYFRSVDGSPYLLDQGGSPLSAIDNAPYVALIPYGMASPPQSFYAAGVTNKQFTMHAVNGSTVTSSATPLSSGVNSTFTVPAGDTAVTVNLSCAASTTSDLVGDTPKYQNQTANFSYTVTANGGTVTNGTGTVPVVWNSDGSQYTGSATISCSVPAGDVITVNVGWGSHTDETGSASYTVTSTAATGATGVNFIAMVSESW